MLQCVLLSAGNTGTANYTTYGFLEGFLLNIFCNISNRFNLELCYEVFAEFITPKNVKSSNRNLIS